MAKRKGKISPPSLDQGAFVRVPEDTDDKTPVWCLNCTNDADHGLAKLDRLQKSGTFLEAIHTRSAITWKEINTAPKTGLGWEKGDFIQRNRPTMALGKTLMIFRMQGNQGRIVGFREGRVFNIVWIDSDLSLYRH